MPGMTAAEAIHAVAYYKSDSTAALTCAPLRAAEAAIREAFEVRDRARAELARMEALAQQNGGLPFASAERQITLLKRILGEEGSA
jgi:hypothetical protein